MQLLSLSKNNSDYAFQCSMPVRVADLAGGLHVGNHVLISYLTEAQMQLMKALGFAQCVVANTMPINAHLEISYKAEAKYNDTLDIGLSIDHFEDNQYRLIFNVEARERQKTVCQSRFLMKFIDVKSHQSCAIPPEFTEAYKRLADAAVTADV